MDTPGKTSFAAVAVEQLRETCHGDPIDGVLLCFALNDTQSFAEVEKVWAPVANALKVPTVLCGTKTDLQPNEDGGDSKEKTDEKEEEKEDDTFIQDREACVQITPNQGAALAEKLGCARYVECSALTRVGLDNAIHSIVLQAVLRIVALEQAAKREQEQKERALKEQEEKRRAEYEQFQALGIPTVVVLGPPCSGKTSFIGALLGEKWKSDYLPGANVTTRTMPIQSKYYNKVQFVDVPDCYPDKHELIGRVAKQSPNCFYFVCVPVVEIRAFSRLARQYTEMIHAADAPGQVIVIGTKVDLVQLEIGEGDDCRTVPYFMGIDHATGERVANTIGAIGYIECSVVSMFGVKNALDELLPHVIKPRTAGQNVRGALRGAGMFFGWLAESLINTARVLDENDEDFDVNAGEDEAEKGILLGQKDEVIVGNFDGERVFQVFVCGVQGSGKTTLVRRYLREPFVSEAPSGSNGSHCFSIRGKPYVPRDFEITLWDCATLMPLFPDNHSKCSIVFAVDVSRADSLRKTIALFHEMELQFGTLFCGRVLALTHVSYHHFCCFIYSVFKFCL